MPRTDFATAVATIFEQDRESYLAYARARYPNMYAADYEEVLGGAFLHAFARDTLSRSFEAMAEEQGLPKATERLRRTFFLVIRGKLRDAHKKRARHGEQLASGAEDGGASPLETSYGAAEASALDLSCRERINRRIEEVIIPRTTPKPWLQEALRVYWYNGGEAVSLRDLGRELGGHLTPESARTILSRCVRDFHAAIREDAVLQELSQ